MKKLFLSVFVFIFAFSSYAEMQKKRLFSYRSFNPAFVEMKTFADYGVNTVAIFPANTCNSRGDPYSKYPPNWLGIDRYDFSIVDKQIDDVLAINPNADFIFIVDLNSPLWLSRRLALFGHSIESDSFTCLSSTLANPLWQEYTQSYLKNLLKHTEKKYGTRIKAYLLACGQTDEWMDYSSYSAGRSKIKAWENWLTKNGETIRSIPSLERFSTASFENFLRDPKKEKDLLKYIQFNNDLIVDSISNFAKITRENISKDKQVGVFFGYIMELTRLRLVAAGHLGYERLFADKNIDFFQSPATYSARNMGDGSGFMCADGTRKSYGKGWLHEVDHFTYMCDPKLNKNIPITGFPGDENRWKTSEESCAGLKREINLVLVNNASIWFFDMVGGWFNTKDMMQTIQRGHEIWQSHQDKNYKSIAEIALIADPQSAMYVNDFNRRVSKIYPNSRNVLNKIGTPFDVYSFNDIERIDMSQYKFFVFPGSFKIDKHRMDVLKKYIFKDGKTSLFLYAPAIINEHSLDVQNVKNFIGIDYATKGVNFSNKGDYNIAYVHNYEDFNVDVARDLAKKSGVRMLSESGDVVYANEKLLSIHSSKGGKRLVKLPFKCSKVTELYTKKVVGYNCDEIEITISKPDTLLFELEK